MSEQWVVLFTKSNAERQVSSALYERGIEVFLPTVKRRYGHQWQECPFFPCYLFARVDFEQVSYSTVAWTLGLRRVVAFGDRLAVMPDEAIEMIRQRLTEIEAQGGLPTYGFQRGDEVRFKEGPLQGLHAIFEGPMEPAERVQVLIRFLGQTYQREVAAANLERVPQSERKQKRPRRTRGRGRRIRQPADASPRSGN